MWNPATALLWEWWRMTRRQVLFFVALGGLPGWALLSRASAADVQGAAYAVFLLLVSVAVFAWVAMLARSARDGFPMTLAYARPVRTRLLVAVPLTYLALACAATYAGPAIALRLAFGAPFPVLPVAVLLAAGAVLFAACNWFTRAKVARFGASIVLLVGGLGPALRWLDPWKSPPTAEFPPPLTVDSLALDVVDYAAIAVAAAVAYAATVYGVERQRRGDSETARYARGPAAADRIAKRGMVEQVRDAVIAAVRVRCPTSSPLAAEIWIEATARGLPVVAIGALLALAMPLTFMVGKTLGPIALGWIGFAAVLPFFVGISTSFWSRESSLRAPMSAFEAARPLTTARLVAVQVGVAAAAMLAAWCLIGASAWWSLPIYGNVVDHVRLKAALAGAIAAAPYSTLGAAVFAALVAFASVVALLAAIRALSVLYGLRLWLGMLAVLAYLSLVALAPAQEWVSAGVGAAVVGAHLWAVAAAIPLAALWLVVRALADGSLLPAQAGILAVVTVLFAASLAFLGHGGEALAGWAPALAAAALASLLLPLASGALAAWSLGRMRHA